MSDAQQQLTPTQLQGLLNKLVYRNPGFDNKSIQPILEQLRDQIDSIDEQMLELLAKRMKITEDIGKYKKENNIAVFQLKRWESIFTSRNIFGEKLGLSKDFLKRLLQLVHKESIQKQVEIMRKKNS